LRLVLLICLFAILFPVTGISQFTLSGVHFYENGQPTRNGTDAAMFPDSPFRTKLDLNGQWEYTVDGKTWQDVVVPSAYDASGKMTFQRTFEITADMLDSFSFSLVVYGINYQSEISVNGNFVGRHSGGYTSFVIPIPPNTLQVGKENAIRVSVDNELTPKTTLPLKQQIGGWRTYGGIFRDIYILATPKVYIEDFSTQSDLLTETKSGNISAKISVHADITERGSDQKVLQMTGYGFQFEVYDKLAGTLVGRSGITPITPQVNKTVGADAEAVIPAPKLWSPESPDLYVVKAQIVTIANKTAQNIDEYSADLGIRTLQWKDGRVVLNSNPVLLKGILWVEDHATYGSAMTYDALERDVALMKSLGANCVRFLAPPHPYMLNLCDRYGLFVMEDVPVTDVPVEILGKDYYQELATTYAREMVARDRRHVSVLAWGIGNEFETLAPAACDFVNDMRNIIRAADHRMVYFATRFIKDPCFEYVDCIALNSYGEDPKVLREALRQCRQANAEKPIILARYGKVVEPGNHNGYSDPLSMESQARYAMQVFNTFQDAKIAGGILWSFNDWRTDRAALTTHSHDPYLSAMGIVGASREKRTAFDVMRALFGGEKVQALPVGNYSSNAPMIFVVMGFVALISFAFVYNANRRFRDSVNRSLFRTYNFFADVRDQRLLTYGQSIFLAIVVAVTWATMLASVFSHYRDNLLLDNLASQFLADGVKEWFIILVWSPLKFIVGFTLLMLVLLLLVSVIIRLASLIVRTHVSFYHSFSITIWATLPYVLFIPLAMLLFRLMEAELYTGPIFILMMIISVWVFIRLLKGISIIYDVFPIKVYAIGLLIVIVMSAAVYGYLDYTKSTTAYLKYMIQTMRSSL
jgi:hypothetical protein